jgi:hypothetical protein
MRRILFPRWTRNFGIPLAVASALISSPFAKVCAQAPAASVADERVNDAMKRAAKFFLEKQDPKTGGIHENLRNEVTMTSLSLLALAAMGHQPSDATPEGDAMKRALDFVLKPENQDARGYFGKSDGSRMYGHGIITLMLSEMLGMGADERQDTLIRERARKAIQLILDSQRMPKNEANRGGWRYTPDAADSDMSVTCWQVMALRAAKNAGMDVPKEAIELAIRYIRGLYDPGDRRGGLAGFGYSGRGRELSTTAEGLLALQVCGDYDSDEVKGAGERLFKSGIKPDERWFFYTAYYYAQGMYQRGDKYAAEGKKVVAEVLLPMQSAQGWWEGRGGEERQGGKIYATALAVLALSVKNHYLPIYQR